ncbi:FAD-dependent oxidoreductase, partial [Parabacteroides sp. OttesenSCG-928-G21]|nr:FAD-dependent oxidoreductase [Parabacteroides sp. OttesenSCG-928-G21]
TVYHVKARTVINATGVFADDILQMNEPGKRKTVRPSQGIHLILDASFLQSDHAIMIPSTPDGRVLFAVPWHNKVVVGTTDTLMKDALEEPVAMRTEVDFILETAGRYLTRPPKRSDVLSVFAGLRPLAAPRDDNAKTKEISRSHKLMREKSGLITIIGGKWTTYRKMAEDTVDMALKYMGKEKHPCITGNYPIHGSRPNPDFSDPLYVYGTDADKIKGLVASSAEMQEKLHPDYAYTKGEIIWLIRNEMPCTVEDVLARRLRILFMDARAAISMAPAVAKWLAEERGKDRLWAEEQVTAFNHLASNYILEQ